MAEQLFTTYRWTKPRPLGQIAPSPLHEHFAQMS